jgi:hypothetical protein
MLPRRRRQEALEEPTEPDHRRSLALRRQNGGEPFPPHLAQHVRVSMPCELLMEVAVREHAHTTAGASGFFPSTR